MAKVFVGLSGGVDSAVSAALLKEQGHDVIGAFIKIWRPEFIECPWQKERLDAMRVAAHLGIPFKEIDLSEEYKTSVIDSMIKDYEAGITPNPDILCNRDIKFGFFKKWALSEGAEKIATGHYARIQTIDVGLTKSHMLLRGKDENKDQSYFLSQLSQEDLGRTLFPVGEYTKSHVRALAEKFKLPVAAKRDSQGLCFVGEVSMRDFLARYITLTPGIVLDEKGAPIGEHDGAALYTIGERHGFRITNHSPHDAPHFVTHIDTSANTISVSKERNNAARTRVDLVSMHWIRPHVQLPARFLAQARYRETPVAVEIMEHRGEYRATFDTPHLAPPGQTLALFDGESLIGSAILGTHE